MLALPCVRHAFCQPTAQICSERHLHHQYFHLKNCHFDAHPENWNWRKTNLKKNERKRKINWSNRNETHICLALPNCNVSYVNVFVALITELCFFDLVKITFTCFGDDAGDSDGWKCVFRFWGVFHHLIWCYVPFFSCLKKRNIKHRYSLVCCVIPLAIFGHLNTLTLAKSEQVVTVSVNVSRRVRAGGTKQNEMKRDSMEMFMSFRSR